MVETAGSGVGQVGSPTLAHTPPLTTLTHVAVGETREVGGRGEMLLFAGWHQAGPAGPPTTPEEGEAGWRAWRVDRHTAEPLHPPAPVGKGGTGGRAGVRVQEWRSFPDEG